MTLEEIMVDLRAAGANENTVRLAMNCYIMGQVNERIRLAAEIAKLPFGDTAASFAAFVRNGGKQ